MSFIIFADTEMIHSKDVIPKSRPQWINYLEIFFLYYYTTDYSIMENVIFVVFKERVIANEYNAMME